MTSRETTKQKHGNRKSQPNLRMSYYVGNGFARQYLDATQRTIEANKHAAIQQLSQKLDGPDDST